MSFGQNAIIARMGLDLNGLRGDLTAGEKLVVRAANRMQSELNNATKGQRGRSGSGGGHGGAGGSKVRPIGDAINAATGTSGAVNELGMITHNLGVGAGAAVGGLVIAKVLHEIAKAMIEVHDASNKAEKSLGKGTSSWFDKFLPHDLKQGVQAGDRPVQSEEGSRERFAELEERKKELQKSRGFWTSVGSAVFGTRDTGVDRSVQAEQDLETERLKLSAQIAGKVMEESEAREILVRHSQHEGELAKLHLETVEKIKVITDQMNSGKMGVEEGHARIAAARADEDRGAETIDLKAAALKRETNGQIALNSIRVKGDDESVAAALQRVTLARHALEDARTGEQIDAAAAKLDTAELEYYFAEKTRDEERRGQSSAIAIAQLRGDADTKHMAALIAERNLIQAKMADPRSTKDQQRQYAVDYAANQEAQRGASNAAAMRSFDTGGALIDANMGVGQGQQQAALAQKLALEKARLVQMQNSPESGPQAIAEQQAKVAQMARSYADAAHQIAVGNKAAQGQTAEMRQQLGYQTTIASAVQEQLDYALKIEEANRNGNQQLEEQLKMQQHLALATTVRKAQDARQETNGLSLGDLATKGGKWGRRARYVNRLEQRADNMTAHGRIAEGNKLRDRANTGRRIMADAGVIKPSEANKDMGAQIDKSKLLEEIKKNTEKLGVNL